MSTETAFIHRFTGFWGCASWCRAIVARHADGTADVVLIGGRVDEDNGTSVTNMSEWIAAEVYRDHLRGLVRPDRVRWYEVYHDELRADPETDRLLSYGYGHPALDRVTYYAVGRPWRTVPHPAQLPLCPLLEELAGAATVPRGVGFWGVDGAPRWRPAAADEREAIEALIGRHLDTLDLKPKPLSEREARALRANAPDVA